MSIVTGVVAGVAIMALVHHVWQMRVDPNIRAIKKWMLSMDIVAHGQRYQGCRTDVLHTFYITNDAPGSVSAKYLCRTKSGRYFDIEVTSELAQVTRWQLDTVSPSDGQLALSIINGSKQNS